MIVHRFPIGHCVASDGRVGVAEVQAILAVEDVLEQFAAAQARVARWVPEPMPAGWCPPAVARAGRR